MTEKVHGQRSLAGYHPWGHKELDTTKVNEHTHVQLLSELFNSSCCELLFSWTQLSQSQKTC